MLKSLTQRIVHGCQYHALQSVNPIIDAAVLEQQFDQALSFAIRQVIMARTR
jgi:hypothetical protein